MICSLLLLLVANGAIGQGHYREVFFDGFSGTELNTKNWWAPDNCMTGDPSCHPGNDVKNAPRQIENLEISGGTLKIYGRNDRDENGNIVPGATDLYTSGEINSTRRWRFGKIDIRCKIAKGQGFNSAAALYSESTDCNHHYNEIDVFENPGHDDLIWTTNYHFDKDCEVSGKHNAPWKTCQNDGDDHEFPANSNLWKQSVYPGDDLADYTTSNLGMGDAFNTFGFEWYKEGKTWPHQSWERLDAFETAGMERTVLKWYLNDVLIRSTTLDDAYLARRQFYDYPALTLTLGLNLFYDKNPASGCHGWDGVGDDSVFPGVMEIDFVRVSKWIKCSYASSSLDVCNYDIVNSVDEPSEGGCEVAGSPVTYRDCWKEDLSSLHWNPQVWDAENVNIAGSGCEFTLESGTNASAPYNKAGYLHVFAANRIRLKEGFRVRGLGRFHGEIITCGGAKTSHDPEELPIEDRDADRVGLTIFPNPTTGSATIDLSLPPGVSAQIDLYDLNGNRMSGRREVFEAHQLVPLDLNGIVAGVYLLKVSTDTRSYFRKIIRL